MNDALGMYLVIKAEHEALLAELADRERRRGHPRAARRGRWHSVAAGWIRRLRRPGRAGATGFAS